MWFRLDSLLSKRYNLSRTSCQKLIEKGLVLVSGELPKKRDKLKEGDEVEIKFPLPEFPDLTPEAIPLSILFEDPHLIVINKPAGLVVHPGAGNWRGTLVNALLYHCLTLPKDNLRPGIVHRLDKDTSGVMVAAKTEQAHIKLVESFAKREVQKEYLAIVKGNPGSRQINAPIARDPRHRQRMAIVEEGKEAETRIETLQTEKGYSLVRAHPRTGRTHQIRVHLKHVGTPIVGDAIYGKEPAPRQLLHAHRLSFPHPITRLQITFEAPLPEDLVKFFVGPKTLDL